MRKIVAGLYVSLDGVVESPEQWTGPYFDQELGQSQLDISTVCFRPCSIKQSTGS